MDQDNQKKMILMKKMERRVCVCLLRCIYIVHLNEMYWCQHGGLAAVRCAVLAVTRGF